MSCLRVPAASLHQEIPVVNSISMFTAVSAHPLMVIPPLCFLYCYQKIKLVFAVACPDDHAVGITINDMHV